jgi:hypothetical protein
MSNVTNLADHRKPAPAAKPMSPEELTAWFWDARRRFNELGAQGDEDSEAFAALHIEFQEIEAQMLRLLGG